MIQMPGEGITSTNGSSAAVKPITEKPGIRVCDFWLLWSGQLVSNLGSALGGIAIPLIAVILLKATPFQMGVLSALQSMPNLLLALLAGALADRVRKRGIMMGVDAGRALMVTAIGLLATTGRLTIESLGAMMFCIAAMGVFFDISYVAIIPTLVSRERLLKANTAIQGAHAASSLAGRSMGGMLIAVLSAPVAMYTDALTYVISFASLWFMHTTEPSRDPHEHRSAMLTNILEGLQFARKHAYVRALLGYAATSNFFISGLFAVYVLYLSDDLHISATFVGIILAMLATGSLAGTVIAPKVTNVLGFGRAVTMAALIASGGAWLLIVVGSASTAIAIQTTGLAVLGAALTIVNVNISVLTQAVTPARLLARVVGVTQFVCSIMLPAGALISGVIGEYAGTRLSIALVAAGLMLTTCWLVFSPIAKLKALPVGEGQSAED